MQQSSSRAGAASGAAAEDLTCRAVRWSPGEHGGGGKAGFDIEVVKSMEPGEPRHPPTSIGASCL
jgi:hypothetical protein